MRKPHLLRSFGIYGRHNQAIRLLCVWLLVSATPAMFVIPLRQHAEAVGTH